MSGTLRRLALYAFALALLALASGGRPDEPGPPASSDGGSSGRSYRVIAGQVARVDRAEAQVEIDLGGSTLVLSYDRNTSVFLDGRLGTIRDVTPGARVRAAIDERGLAFWIEVTGKGAAPR